MNIYEFTQALWRQKWLLLFGVLLLVPAAYFLASSREPKYEASIQIAVVAANLESLAVVQSESSSFAAAATLYAALLRSSAATHGIEQTEQIDLIDLGVTTSSRDRFITVKSTASTPEAAVSGALGSFDWLHRRLVEPPTLATTTPTTILSSILDEEGLFAGVIRLDISGAFRDEAVGLWLVVRVAGESVAAISIADAALEDGVDVVADIGPNSALTLVLEDTFEVELDTISKVLPPLPGPDTVPYTLVVRIDRGSLATSESVQMVPERIGVSWEAVAAGKTPTNIGLLLVNEDPSAEETGTRRGPILLLGALMGGAFALITGATVIDTWTQARREEAARYAEQGEATGPGERVAVSHAAGAANNSGAASQPDGGQADVAAHTAADEAQPWNWRRSAESDRN